MRPEDVARLVISLRGRTSRVALHKVAYLSDNEFVRRRIAASAIASLLGRRTIVRNETGLRYKLAKLGPFSTRLQNAAKALIASGEVTEVFDDGRFVYAPARLSEPRAKEYLREVFSRFAALPDEELIRLALSRSRFDPTLKVRFDFRSSIKKERKKGLLFPKRIRFMSREIRFEEFAKRVIEGDYDRFLKYQFVGKNRKDKELAGYLSGVKKSIALLLYAASKGERIRLTDATNELFISRSSAHKLLRRKLIEQGLVEVVRERKRMKFRLTEKGRKLAEELAEILSRVNVNKAESEEPGAKRDELLELIRKRAEEIRAKAQKEPTVKVERQEADEERNFSPR